MTEGHAGSQLSEQQLTQMTAVFTFFGLTMLQVQMFEMEVGRLWLVVLTRRGKPPTDFKRGLDRVIRRMIHAAQNATPSGLQKEMKDDVSDEILERIAWGIEWRNVLAHRFLRERLRTDVPGGRFADETIPLLLRLNEDFQRATREIADEANRQLATLPEPEEVPEGVQEVFREIAREIHEGTSFGDKHVDAWPPPRDEEQEDN